MSHIEAGSNFVNGRVPEHGSNVFDNRVPGGQRVEKQFELEGTSHEGEGFKAVWNFAVDKPLELLTSSGALPELSEPDINFLNDKGIVVLLETESDPAEVKDGFGQGSDEGQFGKPRSLKKGARHLVLPVAAAFPLFLAACGGGAEDRKVEVSFPPFTPTPIEGPHTPTAKEEPTKAVPTTSSTDTPGKGGDLTPVATAKVEATPTATVKPTEVAPTVTGPTEASKAKVIGQMPATLTSINTNITALNQPLSSNVQLEQFKQDQAQVAASVNAINEALAKNDTIVARNSLIDLKNLLYNMGDPFKAVFPTKEMIAAHDPKNKYLQKFSIDPALMKDYLSVIDMLVATDPSY